MAEDEITSGQYVPFPGVEAWAGFDPAVTDTYAARLTSAKDTVTADDLDRAVRVATRYAAVDTGAIEGLYTVDRGFTRTIATEAASWEATLRSHGESVERSVNDALAAYEMVLDAVTRQQPVSQAWIRRLHEVMCASQETYTVYTAIGPQDHELPKGQYKTAPNSPTNASTGRVHHDASVDDTGPEMARLVDVLGSPEFGELHPVVQAAYAHYAYVCVHPFADGNGRVARALASVYLYRSPGVPLVVFADQREEYLDALEAADRGDHPRFVRFVEQRTLDTVGLVEELLPNRAVPAAADSLARFRAASTGRGGLTHEDLDDLADRVLDLCRASLDQKGQDLTVAGHQVSFVFGAGSGDTSSPAGFRSPSARYLMIEAVTMGPVTAVVQRKVAAWVAKPGTVGPDIVVGQFDDLRPLELFTAGLWPIVSQATEIRIDSWASRFIDELVAEVVDRGMEQLRAAGYLPDDG